MEDEELASLDALWRAANYIAAGMIYLRDNALLRAPLEPGHVKLSPAIDVIDRVPGLLVRGAHAKQRFRDEQADCVAHAHEHRVDRADIESWTWSGVHG